MVRHAAHRLYGFGLLLVQWACGRATRRTVTAGLLSLTGLSNFIIIDREVYRIWFHSRSSLAQRLWIQPKSRMREERLIRAYVKPGDTVVDLGANIGTTVFAAAVSACESGRVFAVEPHPVTFQCLQHNTTLNGFDTITAFECAVGAEESVMYLTDRTGDDQNYVTPKGSIRVQVHTLDNLLKPYKVNRIHFMKIDVEGFEEAVLQGSPETLQVTDCVYFETLDSNLARFDSSQARLFAILREYGFEIYRVPHEAHYEALALRDRVMFSERTGGMLLERVERG